MEETATELEQIVRELARAVVMNRIEIQSLEFAMEARGIVAYETFDEIRARNIKDAERILQAIDSGLAADCLQGLRKAFDR